MLLNLKNLASNLAVSLLSLALFVFPLEVGSDLYLRHRHKLNEYEEFIEKQGVTRKNKQRGERRIFLIGESAARGVPYEMESSMSGFLAAMIQNDNDSRVRLINTGMPGRHSFYQKEEGKSLVRYGADGVIFYAGNNDTRDFSNVMRDVPFAFWDFKLTWHSSFYRVLKRQASRVRSRTNDWTNKKVFLQNNNQDDLWHWTDIYLKKKKRYLEDPDLGAKRKSLAIQDYEKNLDSLASYLIRHGIKVYIVELPIIHEVLPSIGDYPRKGYTFKLRVKFKTEAERRAWRKACEEGLAAIRKKRWNQALSHFLEAQKINSSHPRVYHLMGRCYAATGEYLKAKKMYEKAKEIQIQSPGGDGQKSAALKRIAARHHLPLFASQTALEELSPHGIVGRNLFLDHCHPNVLGHKVIAAVMMAGLCKDGFLRCQATENDWHVWFEKISRGKINPANLANEYLLTGFYLFNGTTWSPKPDFKTAVYYLEKARKITPEKKEIYPLLAASYWNIGRKDKSLESLNFLKKIDASEYYKAVNRYPYLVKTEKISAEHLLLSSPR